jgi:hypothetical protein
MTSWPLVSKSVLGQLVIFVLILWTPGQVLRLVAISFAVHTEEEGKL